jgi:hypothetical protein
VGDSERAAGSQRIFVETAQPRPVQESDTRRTLHPGDVVAVSGRRTTLVEVLESPGNGLREVDDKEPSSCPAISSTWSSRTRRCTGVRSRSSGSQRRAACSATHHAWRRPDRGAAGDHHRSRRCHTIVGTLANTTRGRTHRCRSRATDATDMFVVATGIVAGALIGRRRCTSEASRSV